MIPDIQKLLNVYTTSAYMRFCICVTNCDLSADVHCVFWAVGTDTVPALYPAFSWGNELGREFYAGFGYWYSYEQQAKNISVICAFAFLFNIVFPAKILL